MKPVTQLIAILLLVSLAPTALAESYLNKRVTIVLKAGSTIRGTVVNETAEKITVQVSRGQVTLGFDVIEKIDIDRPPVEIYEERKASCETADDWVKLARWCSLGHINLKEQRTECLDKALELDPEHEDAHRERRDVLVKGTWYPEEEGNTLLGKVKVGDKWYPPHEAERLKRLEQLKRSKAGKKLVDQVLEREGIPWATADVIETEFYRVKCNSTEKVAKRYAEVMDALYAAYDSVFPASDFPRFTEEKGTIYIFRNNEEFLDFTLMSRGVGGFFSFSDRAVRAYHGSFGVTGSTDMVLAHEATHQFQYRIMSDMRTVPTWLIEGMAVYYGDGTEISPRKVELHKIPRDRLQTLQEAIEGGRYTPVQRLIRIPQSAFGGQFYNHAWGVIYWCLQGDKFGAHKGEGKAVWDKYLQHVCRESPKLSSVMATFGKHMESEAKLFEELLVKETAYENLQAWETDYKKFITDLKLDPLGEWRGSLWDGSLVGLEMRFPGGLAKVPDRYLRHASREAAAAQPKSGKARIWITVDANWFGQVAPATPEAYERIVKGFFRRAGDYLEKPSVIGEAGRDLTRMVATFKGRLQPRREVGAGGKSRGQQKKPDPESGEKKDAGGSRSQYQRIGVNDEIKVKLLFISTQDKLYTVCLAGVETDFAKLEPAFNRALNSVKLK